MEDNATTFTLNTSHDDRSWHLMCRDDKSVCLYWTRDSDPGQYVVYDSLDESGLAALQSQNDSLSQMIVDQAVELGKTLRQRDSLRDTLKTMRSVALEALLATPT